MCLIHSLLTGKTGGRCGNAAMLFICAALGTVLLAGCTSPGQVYSDTDAEMIAGTGAEPASAADNKTASAAGTDTKTASSAGADSGIETAILAETDEEPGAAGTDASPDNAAGTDASPDTAAETDASPAPDTVTICMVGDILLHTPVEEAAKRDDGSYDYGAVFSQTADLISGYDIAIVNEEVIIGGESLGVSGYPAFNAPFEIGDALVDAGFDVVLHATNHALDKGAKGVSNCCSYWQDNHPETEVLGIHDSEEDRDHISILEVNGISLAILNYTYGTNGINVPSDMPYCVDLLDEDRVVSDLERAEDMADFTIVCPHWGTEYRLTPDPSQLKWATLMAGHGADLIIGTHPHVIEPVEWVSNEDSSDSDSPDRTGTLVYYSLGNFVNWTSGTGPGTSDRLVGGMADITLSRDGLGEVVISDHGITALVTDLRPGPDGVTVYKLADYNEELASSNAILSQDPSFSYEYCVSLCDSVWGGDYR